MKTTKLMFAALAALALGSCQNDGEELPKQVTADIQCNIGDNLLSTRAYDATWVRGDKIGLFVENGEYTQKINSVSVNFANMDYTTTGTTEQITVGGVNRLFVPFTGTYGVPFPSDNSYITFNAYHPYKQTLDKDGNNKSVIFTVSNWTDQENYVGLSNPLDLLVANQESQNATGKEVKLTFKHQFCKLILNVEANTDGTALEEGCLDGMVVSAVDMNYVTKCNVLTGDIDPIDVTEDDIEDFNFNLRNGKYEALIIPDVFPSQKSKIVFKLRDGKTFTWIPEIPASANVGKKFAKGNSYIWNLRLNGTSVDAVLKATIINWTENEFYSENPFDIQQDK